jgi:hypothetical protein
MKVGSFSLVRTGRFIEIQEKETYFKDAQYKLAEQSGFTADTTFHPSA